MEVDGKDITTQITILWDKATLRCGVNEGERRVLAFQSHRFFCPVRYEGEAVWRRGSWCGVGKLRRVRAPWWVRALSALARRLGVP